jgi:hypothetical protein
MGWVSLIARQLIEESVGSEPAALFSKLSRLEKSRCCGKASSYNPGSLGLRNDMQSVMVGTTTRIQVRKRTHIEGPDCDLVNEFPEVRKSTSPLDTL